MIYVIFKIIKKMFDKWLFICYNLMAAVRDGYAEVAESADALDSGSSDSNIMRVQVPSSAPIF